MVKKLLQEKYLTYIFIFTTALIINYYTPFNGDDYKYAFNYSDGSRITNIFDVIESQFVHYKVMNGRFIPHFLEQIFAGITGKWLFNIINSFILIWFIELITNRLKCYSNTKEKNYFRILTFLASLFLFSYPGQTIYWMAGALNYLWPMTFALYLLTVFEEKQKYNTILLFTISLISAWFQEAISIVFCISLILLMINDKNVRSINNIIIILGYILGTSLIVFSPGTLTRLSGNDVVHSGDLSFIIASKLLCLFESLKKLYIFWITIVLIIIYLFKTPINKFYHKYKLELIIWITNICFLLLLGFSKERVTIMLSIISYILCVRIFFDLFKIQRLSSLSRYFLVATLIISSIYGILTCYQYNKWVEGLEYEINKSNKKKVVLQYDKYNKQSRLFYPQEFTSNFNSVYNRKIAMYFEKDFVQVLTKELYNEFYKIDIEKYSQGINHFFITPTYKSQIHYYDKLHIYYFEIPQECLKSDIKIMGHIKNNNNNLSKYQKVIRRFLNTLNNTTHPIFFQLVYKDNKYYCILSNFDKKVTSIKLYSSGNKLLGYIL